MPLPWTCRHTSPGRPLSRRGASCMSGERASAAGSRGTVRTVPNHAPVPRPAARVAMSRHGCTRTRRLPRSTAALIAQRVSPRTTRQSTNRRRTGKVPWHRGQATTCPGHATRHLRATYRPPPTATGGSHVPGTPQSGVTRPLAVCLPPPPMRTGPGGCLEAGGWVVGDQFGGGDSDGERGGGFQGFFALDHCRFDIFALGKF
jgi:hypothetical protein